MREDLQINEDTSGKLLMALLDVDQGSTSEVMNETEAHGGDLTDYYQKEKGGRRKKDNRN